MRAVFAIVLALGAGCAHRHQHDQVTAEVEVVEHESSTTGAYADIELNGAFSVDLIVGDEVGVELQGEQAAVDAVVVEVNGESLSLSTRKRRLRHGTVHVTVHTPRLESIEVNGAARLDMTGLTGGELAIEVNGTGTTVASGQVDALDIELNGAGSFDALELIARSVDIEISGTGSAKVHATESLAADVSGVGSVRYAGQPKSVDREVSGVGTVKPI